MKQKFQNVGIPLYRMDPAETKNRRIHSVERNSQISKLVNLGGKSSPRISIFQHILESCIRNLDTSEIIPIPVPVVFTSDICDEH